MFKRVLLAVSSMALCAHAGIIMEVVPSVAPNTSSPSFAGWRANAINALENGLTSVGDAATDPAAYRVASQLGDGDNIVSSFPSWHGTADPGTAFGPAFANEQGNILLFGLRILGTDGTTFSLSNLHLVLASDDPAATFHFVFDYASFDYNAGAVGIDPATGNPITSGPSAQQVSALYYAGAGAVFATPGGTCVGTGQGALDCVKAKYDAIMPFHMTADYQLLNGAGGVIGSATGSVPFENVPEPGTWAMLPFAAIGLAGWRLVQRYGGVRMAVAGLSAACLLALSPAPCSAAPSEPGLAVEFAGCIESIGVGLAQTAAVSPLIPKGFHLAGEGQPVTPLVIRTSHCDVISVNGDLARGGSIVQIGPVIVPPQPGATIDNYALWYYTSDQKLAHALQQAGVDAQYVPTLNYVYLSWVNGAKPLAVAVFPPGDPTLLLTGLVTPNPVPSGFFIANWWSRGSKGVIRMNTNVPSINIGQADLTLHTDPHGALGQVVGGSSFPFLLVQQFNTFGAARMEVTSIGSH